MANRRRCTINYNSELAFLPNRYIIAMMNERCRTTSSKSELRVTQTRFQGLERGVQLSFNDGYTINIPGLELATSPNDSNNRIGRRILRWVKHQSTSVSKEITLGLMLVERPNLHERLPKAVRSSRQGLMYRRVKCARR